MNNSKFWIDHFSQAPAKINQAFINLKVDSMKEVLKDFDVKSK